jgi:hypothetical protein
MPKASEMIMAGNDVYDFLRFHNRLRMLVFEDS